MMQEKVIMSLPWEDPNLASMLSNLSVMLGLRFERTGVMEDLNRAVGVADKAVKATPLDHPNRAALLNNLGNRVGMRFQRTGAMEDQRRSFFCFKEGWECKAASI
jgi:hypothetical protein